MKPERLYYGGERGRPLILFIHGMGMDAGIWSKPAEARVLGGLYPLGVLFNNACDGMITSFADLKERGYPVLAWSQSRPAGPVEAAVEELSALVDEYKDHSSEGIILIGHSRGGLVARKYLEGESAGIRGIMTLASPHRGTSLARLAGYAAPAAALLDRVLENYTKKDLSVALQRVCRFLGSRGLKELLPGSPFLEALSPVKRTGVRYFSAGGTDPDMFRIRSFSLSEFAAKIVPSKLLPDELRRGLGDGLVAAASAVMPQAEEHRDFAVHHVSILFDREVRDYVADSVETI
jgi:pimeloyl-ACP methyl ester carboxylesterase